MIRQTSLKNTISKTFCDVTLTAAMDAPPEKIDASEFIDSLCAVGIIRPFGGLDWQ